MKSLSILAVAAMVFATSSVASAQQEKVKYADWQAEMTSLTAKRDSLKNVLNQLNTDITNLKNELAGLDQQYQGQMQKYLGMLGTTAADMKAFGLDLQNMTSEMDNYMKMSDQDLCAHRKDVEAMGARIDSVKASKLALAEEFYNEVQTLENDYSQLKARLANCSTAMTYTVGTWARNRDCLWNIAKKPSIYNDPWRWPKIYMANRNQIKNPDLIYPKEVLTIPQNAPLTREESAAARAYYAKKARMMKAAQSSK
ncbi:MAG: LysM peptidoglycan-binding domain-containing protein [Bacteroidetes bacterium]|nr:LysM peptidoglycan-binding domain-containing protein [Bacteroidota bacterium]